LGGRRQNWGHIEASAFPLCIKLGTLTCNSAGIWGYTNDDNEDTSEIIQGYNEGDKDVDMGKSENNNEKGDDKDKGSDKSCDGTAKMGSEKGSDKGSVIGSDGTEKMGNDESTHGSEMDQDWKSERSSRVETPFEEKLSRTFSNRSFSYSNIDKDNRIRTDSIESKNSSNGSIESNCMF
jgi:hypothetical protein